MSLPRESLENQVLGGPPRRSVSRRSVTGMSTWFITGCSTGLGRALAETVLERGENAAITARDARRLEDLAKSYPDTAVALTLDVTDDEQVIAAVRQAERRFGGIDVLVNNAGYGYRAAVEEGDPADVQRLFATNFFGPVAAPRPPSLLLLGRDALATATAVLDAQRAEVEEWRELSTSTGFEDPAR